MKTFLSKPISLLILGIIIGGIVVYFVNVRISKAPAGEPGVLSQAEIQALTNRIGKLTILPTGEEPAVAMIKNAEGLIKEQPFYTGAINGDIVFVYQNAGKAVVYSPSRNIIVNMGPVVNQPQSTSTPPQANGPARNPGPTAPAQTASSTVKGGR